MRRRQDEDSSLELLLDTMCNTFGGVMFIAISLAVMLSMRGAVERVTADESAEILKTRQQITVLQQQIEAFQKEQKAAEEIINSSAADPLIRLAQEVVILEQMLEIRKLRQKAQESKTALVRTELRDIRNKSRKISARLEEEQKRRDELSRQQEKQEQQLKKLQQELQTLSSGELAFHTLSKKDSPPYFLLMNDNKIWSVGPEMDGVSYVPSDAVEFRAEKGRYVCRGKAGRGTAVFDGENISAELVDLLKKLPENRVPEFVISPGDAAAFCRLRSILKQQKFFHGFRLQKQDKNEFDYQFSNDAQGSYEY